ncbi:MAG: transglutaminase domain-containing protein [Myxococcales bacterium]|nr:transglutaminase domain-containing protein [Myxococcales bacterium]
MRHLSIVLLLTLSFGCHPSQAAPAQAPAPSPGFAWHDPAEPPLERFREVAALDEVLAGADAGLAQVERLTRWVHELTSHDGGRDAASTHPETLWRASLEGEPLRCTEYSILLAGALQVAGFKARVLSLKREDVATAEAGAGHVVVEVYVAGHGWVLADPQFGVVARTAEGRGLHALGLAGALDRGEQLVLATAELDEVDYGAWIRPYLFYLDAAFQQRPFDDVLRDSRSDVPRLMFVPEGAAQPRVFQRIYPMERLEFTDDVERFYAAP